MQCVRCGSLNRSGNDYCENCGSPLGLKCDACQTINGATSRFCGHCGTALTAKALNKKGKVSRARTRIDSRLKQDS